MRKHPSVFPVKVGKADMNFSSNKQRKTGSVRPGLARNKADVVSYRLFWYQVLTCVSVRLRAAARSMRSCTLRYFCRSKLLSSWLSWWSVKAVRALRGFFVRIGGLSLLLEISRSPSSLVPEHRSDEMR